MYILSSAGWFFTLLRQFFFSLDKVIFNMIVKIYDLLIAIARTSILSQSDILEMAERIYQLLAVFMIFKVTFSLIMYVVNPDDFTDKTKGVSKLVTNMIISLGLLILTPFIFNFAFELQTIILEDNSLATLIFGVEEDAENKSFITSAGDEIAFLTLQPFYYPNTSIIGMEICTTIDDACIEAMKNKTNPKSKFTEIMVDTYKLGIDKKNIGLSFRTNLATAIIDDKGEDVYVMEYNILISTAVGVVVLLLLVTFCMDVALRSIKLSFLQLIAPIPIISYVDPKSGKDGLFKKWYQMCFKTFLSLFIRLLALYFAVYIIGLISNKRLVDIVTGAYQTNGFIKVFIIIGALMFAKQLPKMLEGLGIKLDGDGKFFLNPLKKFEDQALGGKRITGAAGGFVAGAIGGKGIGAFGGAIRGFAANKGYKGGLDRQADVNRKLREARIAGAGFWGSRAAVLSTRYGADDADLERRAKHLRRDKRAIELARRGVDDKVKEKELSKKKYQDGIHAQKEKIRQHERMQKSIGNMENRAKEEIQKGNGGSIGTKYLELDAIAKHYENNVDKDVLIDRNEKVTSDMVGKKFTINGKEKTVTSDMVGKNVTVQRSVKVTPEMVAQAKKAASDWLNDEGMKKYMTQASTGTFDDGKDDKTFQNSYKDYKDAAGVIDLKIETAGDKIHTQYGISKGTTGDIKRDIAPIEEIITKIDDEIRNIQVEEKVEIDGKEVSLEEAEQDIKKREQELKDIQDKRKANRDMANNSRYGGS